MADDAAIRDAERAEAIAFNVRTMRVLDWYGRSQPDSFDVAELGQIAEPLAAADQLVKAAGVAQGAFVDFGPEGAICVWIAIAYLTIESLPDLFAAALHYSHNRRTDNPPSDI